MSSRQSFLFPNSLLSAARCDKWAAFNLIMGADVGTFQKHLLNHERENEKTFPTAISHFYSPHFHSFHVDELDFWESKTAKLKQALIRSMDM